MLLISWTIFEFNFAYMVNVRKAKATPIGIAKYEIFRGNVSFSRTNMLIIVNKIEINTEKGKLFQIPKNLSSAVFLVKSSTVPKIFIQRNSLKMKYKIFIITVVNIVNMQQ